MIIPYSMVISEIKKLPPNTEVKKPNSIAYTDGWSENAEGLRYKFGSMRTKIVRVKLFEMALVELRATSQLTRGWFKTTFPKEQKSAPCNFTTIGGVFELLGLVKYAGSGKYVIVNPKELDPAIIPEHL